MAQNSIQASQNPPPPPPPPAGAGGVPTTSQGLIATIGPMVLPQFFRPIFEPVAEHFPLFVTWPYAPAVWAITLILVIVFIILLVVYIVYCVRFIVDRVKKYKTHRELDKVRRPIVKYDESEKARLATEAIQPDENAPEDPFFSDFLNAQARAGKNLLGKLQYSLEYDVRHNALVVVVNRCTTLRPPDLNSLGDPLVVVSLKPPLKKTGGILFFKRDKFETPVRRNTLDPIFNSQFTITAKYDEIKDKSLIFKVMNWSRFGSNELIGMYILPLCDVDFRAPLRNEWAELIEDPDLSSKAKFGDVCVVLKYYPSENELSVTILECKELRIRKDGETLPDPFVKLSLKKNNSTIASKTSKIQKATQTPYFNEEFVFDATLEIIENSVLEIKLCDSTGMGSTPLGILRMGTRGALHVTRTEACPTAEHWAEMLETPKRPTARWHPLFNPKAKKVKREQ